MGAGAVGVRMPGRAAQGAPGQRRLPGAGGSDPGRRDVFFPAGRLAEPAGRCHIKEEADISSPMLGSAQGKPSWSPFGGPDASGCLDFPDRVFRRGWFPYPRVSCGTHHSPQERGGFLFWWTASIRSGEDQPDDPDGRCHGWYVPRIESGDADPPAVHRWTETGVLEKIFPFFLENALAILERCAIVIIV